MSDDEGTGASTGASTDDGSAEGEVVVDARGSRCPVPVIETARAAREHPGGTVLRVLSTDPATALDLPAWCRMRGHDLLDVQRGEDHDIVVRVRLR